jgi:predicted DNA-binding protein (UPF0251 family)
MSPKGRPPKIRYIQDLPHVTQFSPRGKPGRPDQVELTLDQFEAIKLADYQRLSQEQGAAAMRLSRASFGRILRKARKLLADAIVKGKIIRIKLDGQQIEVQNKGVPSDQFQKEFENFKSRTRQISQQIEVIKTEESPQRHPGKEILETS